MAVVKDIVDRLGGVIAGFVKRGDDTIDIIAEMGSEKRLISLDRRMPKEQIRYTLIVHLAI